MKLDLETWLTGCGCHCVAFCRLSAETEEALWYLSWSSHEVTLHWCQHEATFQTWIQLKTLWFVFFSLSYFRSNPSIWNPVAFFMGVVKWMLWLSLFRQFPFFRVILISRLYRLKANIVFPAVHSWPVLVHSKFYTCLTPMDSFSDPDFYCSVRWSNIENNVDHKLVYYRRKSQIF